MGWCRAPLACGVVLVVCVLLKTQEKLWNCSNETDQTQNTTTANTTHKSQTHRKNMQILIKKMNKRNKQPQPNNTSHPVSSCTFLWVANSKYDFSARGPIFTQQATLYVTFGPHDLCRKLKWVSSINFGRGNCQNCHAYTSQNPTPFLIPWFKDPWTF